MLRDAAANRKSATEPRHAPSASCRPREVNVTMPFSYLFGTPSLGMHVVIVGSLGATIGLVLILIIQLTHPFEGDNHISAAAFNALIHDVENAAYPHQ